MTEEMAFTKAELLSRMANGWETFQQYISTLTEEQLTRPTDAAGWTAKDHIAHLAVWEDGVYALLRGESRSARMGIDDEVWRSRDYDRINDVIQKRYRHLSLADALAMFREAHQRLIAQLDSMTDDALKQPYNVYSPNSTRTDPVWYWIPGNTYEHYQEHRPWIAAIVEKA